MSHGRPDWYNIAPLIQIHASEDINELAARLGAPNTVDRRGNVIAYDCFERGIQNWGFDFNDAGNNASWSAHQGMYGALAMRLYTVAGATKYAKATRWLPFPPAGSLGVEWGFSHETIPTGILLAVSVFTGTTLVYYSLKYTYASGVLAYWNGATWVTLYTDTKVFLSSELITNYVKLAVDIDSAEFLRLITGDRSDSMVGIAAAVSASSSVRGVYLEFLSYGYAAGAMSAYLEWLTLTVNER